MRLSSLMILFSILLFILSSITFFIAYKKTGKVLYSLFIAFYISCLIIILTNIINGIRFLGIRDKLWF
jgi:hypothetical protein